MMPMQGGNGPPQMVRSVVADKAAGLTAVTAILAVLLARERGGAGGQRIEVPMLDAYAAFMLPEQMGPRSFPDSPDVPTPFDPFRVYPTADGHVVGMVVQDHQFGAICRAVERPDWLLDARFVGMGDRFQHMDELADLLLAEFRRFATDDLIARARKEGAPFAPVNDFEAFLDDAQVRHSELIQTIDDEDVRVRVLRPPARLSATPASIRLRPPRLGEHTDELLAMVGFVPAAVHDLRERGVVR
jgi:crotonobetainyl-CoA:carnitine CoA-transferase CaiB-like acyl-CoA transferase